MEDARVPILSLSSFSIEVIDWARASLRTDIVENTACLNENEITQITRQFIFFKIAKTQE